MRGSPFFTKVQPTNDEDQLNVLATHTYGLDRQLRVGERGRFSLVQRDIRRGWEPVGGFGSARPSFPW